MSVSNTPSEPKLRTHESVDHVHPTDAGLMSPDDEQIPATGIMGDETLIRMTSDGENPYPGVSHEPGESEHRDEEDAQPGPTRWPNASDDSAGE